MHRAENGYLEPAGQIQPVKVQSGPGDRWHRVVHPLRSMSVCCGVCWSTVSGLILYAGGGVETCNPQQWHVPISGGGHSQHVADPCPEIQARLVIPDQFSKLLNNFIDVFWIENLNMYKYNSLLHFKFNNSNFVIKQKPKADGFFCKIILHIVWGQYIN